MKLKVMVTGILGFTAALSIAACSPSASQLKKVVQENPDIVYAAIEANPKAFFEVIQKAQEKARETSMRQQMDDEFKRVETEMKAPKEVATTDRAFLGGDNAKVTIVEWSDFNCGHCAQAHETVKKLTDEYKDQVRVVYKHLPILAKESKTAAEYMEAIALQDKSKAIQFHDALFEDQKGFREGGEKYLKELTKKVGADVAKAAKDAKGDVVKKRIDGDIEEAQKFDFTGTPGFMVNGASIHGAYPYEFFKKVIDSVIGTKPKG